MYSRKIPFFSVVFPLFGKIKIVIFDVVLIRTPFKLIRILFHASVKPGKKRQAGNLPLLSAEFFGNNYFKFIR